MNHLQQNLPVYNLQLLQLAGVNFVIVAAGGKSFAGFDDPLIIVGATLWACENKDSHRIISRYQLLISPRASLRWV